MNNLQPSPIATHERCTCTLLDNGIYLFVFTEASRRAVREFVSMVEELYNQNTPSTLLRMLIDLRPAGWPPMNAVFRELRNLKSRHPITPRQRFAFIYAEAYLTGVAQSFFNGISLDSRAAFFNDDRENDAVTWLFS